MSMKYILKWFIIFYLISLNTQSTLLYNKTQENKTLFSTESEKILQESNNNLEKIEQNDEILIENEKVEISYRLTSFYTNDGYNTSSCTGSGKCENDFSTNNNGWYTYQGKLVLAAATYECLNSHSGACSKWNLPLENKIYYNYYDIIEIIIDGVTYEGIILDSCGACMYITYEQRIDLFVSNSKYAIDRGYKGVNAVSVVLD